MIIGTGLDIIEIERIDKASLSKPFYTKNFTAGEIALFEAKKYHKQTVAGNFAAKEAVLKSLGNGIFDIPLIDIEILREDSGRPYVSLSGKAAERAALLGVKKIHISISHDGGFAAAQAVAEGD